jgi:hypothetical protein
MQNNLESATSHLLGTARGLSITSALVRLISGFEEIAEVSFVFYKPAPGLDERLARNEDKFYEVREVADHLRRTHGIPFWDAILAICMKRGEMPDQYVDLAILHDRSPDERTVSMEINQLSEASIQSMANNLLDGTALAFSSKVKLKNGGVAHIPLMDFRCDPSETNSKIVQRALKAMGQDSGLLAESGRSYHFYGFRLLSTNEWIRFLAMAMLFSPIVDVRYIAHRLADGACRLRISPSRSKSFTPVVCEIFS